MHRIFTVQLNLNGNLEEIMIRALKDSATSKTMIILIMMMLLLMISLRTRDLMMR